MKIINLIRAFIIKLIHNAEKVNIVSDGYIKEKEDERDYQYGASPLGLEVLNPTAQWFDYLSSYEIQHGRFFDSMGCTGYGLDNNIEVLAKYKWNEDWNKSDRYTNKVTNTTRKGNSMRKVLDWTRKHYGVVNEIDYAWDRKTFTWAKYYSEVPQDIIKKGEAWLKEYELKYENVYTNKQMLKQALKTSPLYVAGFAWALKNGKYYSWGRANHCFIIIGYKENDCWFAFDSYEPCIKRLDWNFNFAYVKVIKLNKKVLTWNEQGIKEFFEARKPLELLQVIPSGAVYKRDGDKLRKMDVGEITHKGIKELDDNNKIVGISQENFNNKFLK